MRAPAMGSASYPTYPAVSGLGDRLSHFFDRLTALPMPEHMLALIEELERTHPPDAAPEAVGADDGLVRP